MNGAASTPGEALKVFTQCSNCHTVFQLSADVLRAAGGQVRCGRCGEIFSALARLAEDANSFDTGESAYEMEERADSILESVVADQVAQSLPDTAEEEDFGGSEIARLQVLDFTEEDLIDDAPEETIEGEPNAADAAMEFTLPPAELDRIFVDSKMGMLPPFPRADTAPMSTGAEPAPPVAPTPPIVPTPATAQLPPIVPTPATAQLPPTAPTPPTAHLPPTAPTPPTAHLTPTAPTLPAAPARPASPVATLAEDEGPLLDIEVVSDSRSGTFDLRSPPQRSAGAFALWCSAAILSALLLLAQVVHRNREALSARGPLAPALRMLYSSMGTPLDGAPNLAVYQLRQWGVTGRPAAGEAAAGQPGAGQPGAETTLRVRASILNTSALLQPFPLLRLTLANRYGTTLGARDFEPSEYMGKPIARSLSPGETVDVILNILDPGKDAEGFEIDVCLRGADKKIICANDAAPPRRKP